MIIKLIGMVTVFFASSALGFCAGECFCSRERELTNMSDAIEMMIGELMYTSSSLKDVINSVIPGLKGQCRNVFIYIYEEINKGVAVNTAWENAIDKTAFSMSLKKSDAQYLIKNSYLLTAYELEEQKKRLCELREKIGFLAEDALRAKNKNTKIVRMLGVYGGALLCVIIF